MVTWYSHVKSLLSLQYLHIILVCYKILAFFFQELWDRASEFPLFGTLHDLSSYHFACISERAETLELMDESKCLQEINPFMWILKVVERKGNETEKLLNIQIGQLIGKGRS